MVLCLGLRYYPIVVPGSRSPLWGILESFTALEDCLIRLFASAGFSVDRTRADEEPLARTGLVYIPHVSF